MNDMMFLTIPEDPSFLAAIGAVACAHSQLDFILARTVKTLASLDLEAADTATAKMKNHELREWIKGLVRKEFGCNDVHLKVIGLLNEALALTDKRNEILHSVFAEHYVESDNTFKPKRRTKDNKWIDLPSVRDLEKLRDDILAVSNKINIARLDGFIKEALDKNKLNKNHEKNISLY